MVDLINKSVTANDAIRLTNPENGSVINLMIPTSYMPQVASLPTDLPPYWSTTRDVVLGATVLHEAMWAAAVDIAITKVASKSWEVRSDIALRTRRGQALLLFADGIVINDNGKLRMKSIGPNVGWVQFLSKHLRNFLCSDNGSFVEIIREKKSFSSKIIGLRHLSSSRCIRTGDPEIPVIYRDKQNRMHELKDYQVMSFVDMPDPDESWNGTGLCAAARSYTAIYKLMSIERYVIEKVTGLKPLAIYVVNGIVQQQLDGAVRAAKEQQVAKGLASYMGAVIIGTPSDKAPEVATIPLAELPDRFNRKEELDLALLTYSNNIGLDPQELQPLSGQGLGTGTQAQVLDDKASGKGLVAWQQQWTHQLNEKVLDDATTFLFIERDYRDMKARADITNTRATGMKTMIDSAIVTPEQAAQIMADLSEIPKEFVPEDLIGGDILSDTEKPQSRSVMNRTVEEELTAEEGETPELAEEETEISSEEQLEPDENEKVVPDSEYEELPVEEEPVSDEETNTDELPKKKRKSFDAVQFKERDILDALKDIRSGRKWGAKPLAIFDPNFATVGRASIVKSVKDTIKGLGENATFTAIHETTQVPYSDIFGVIKYLETYDMVKVLDGGTRVKMYTPETVLEAEDLMKGVEERATAVARKKLLAEKFSTKHFQGQHSQVSHGNRYAHKPPPMPPQLNNSIMGKVQERQRERVSIMEQFYPGVKFSTAVHNPLGVKQGNKLGIPGIGAPLAIYNKDVEMVADPERVGAVVKSAKKWQDKAFMVTFNNLKYDTGLEFSDVFGVVKYLKGRDPYSISFSINRAGDATLVGFKFDKLVGFLEG